MPELSRTQIAVYGAVAVALLLVGARAIRGEGGGGASFAAAPSGRPGTERIHASAARRATSSST